MIILLLCGNHIAWLNFLLCCSLQIQPESNSDYLCYLRRWPLKKEDKETNCVGGCRCGLWYCVLVKKHVKEKEHYFSPHTGPVWKVSLFQGLSFANTAEMQRSTLTTAPHSLNVNMKLYQTCIRMSADKEEAKMCNHTTTIPVWRKILLFTCIYNTWQKMNTMTFIRSVMFYLTCGDCSILFMRRVAYWKAWFV